MFYKALHQVEIFDKQENTELIQQQEY